MWVRRVMVSHLRARGLSAVAQGGKSTGIDAVDSGLLPTADVACTVNVNIVPGGRPMMGIDVMVPSCVVHFAPPGLAVTV